MTRSEVDPGDLVRSDPLITPVFEELIEAAVVMLERLARTPPTPPTRIKTNRRENAPSIAIIVLCAAAIESANNRVFYLQQKKATGREPDSAEAGAHWMRRHLPPDVAAEVREVQAVRNAIMHGHLWAGRRGYDANREPIWVETPTLRLPEKYRKRLDGILDPVTLQTVALGLNLVPIRIWRADAFIAFRLMATAMNALRAHDPTGPDESNCGGYGARFRTLARIAGRLRVPEDRHFPRPR